MSSERFLSLLGLAKRGGRLAVGEEPVEAAARARDARVLLLASDAADNTRRRVEHFARAGQCLWLRIPFSKDELGKALGRPSVAVAALTDVGLAAAAVHRLAELDPVQYDEAAARLDLKAKRAAERKAEQLAHEKNVRTGRKKSKGTAPQSPSPPEPETASSRPRSPAGAGRTRKAAGKFPSARDKRPRPKANPYAHSRPVKKGKGSFRRKEG